MIYQAHASVYYSLRKVIPKIQIYRNLVQRNNSCYDSGIAVLPPDTQLFSLMFNDLNRFHSKIQRNISEPFAIFREYPRPVICKLIKTLTF